jgi:hypothetical protein
MYSKQLAAVLLAASMGGSVARADPPRERYSR